MFRRATLSVITDEVSDDFEESLRFARTQGLTYVELRSTHGTNLLRMPDVEIHGLRRTLDRYGIKAISLASPLLKWPCDSKSLPKEGIRLHGFELAPGETQEFFIRRAFEVCSIVGADRLRVFSFLRVPQPDDQHLQEAFATLVDLAEKNNIQILVEHESVCHVASIQEVDQFLGRYDSPKISLLLDPGNFLEGGESLDVLPAKWLKRIGHIHVKDYDPQARKFVPLGEGKVPFQGCLADLPKCSLDDIGISLETHCPDNKLDATAKSLAELRRILTACGIQAD
jgi:sugar phosphate isomerase/epimerase